MYLLTSLSLLSITANALVTSGGSAAQARAPHDPCYPALTNKGHTRRDNNGQPCPAYNPYASSSGTTGSPGYTAGGYNPSQSSSYTPSQSSGSNQPPPPSNGSNGYAGSSSGGRVITVHVGGTFPNGTAKLQFDPEYVTGVNPGDQVEFVFGVNNHSATVSSFSEPCAHDPIQFDAGFNPVSNTTSFTRSAVLTVADTNPIWMFCRQPGTGPKTHCQQGMVFAINPTPQNTFDAFKANALKSTAQDANSNNPGNTPTSGSGKLFSAAEDGGSSSGSVDLGAYKPAMIGLLALVVLLVLALIGMVITLLARTPKNPRMSGPRFRPIRLSKGTDGSEREAFEYEGTEHKAPMGRYTDES